MIIPKAITQLAVATILIISTSLGQDRLPTSWPPDIEELRSLIDILDAPFWRSIMLHEIWDGTNWQNHQRTTITYDTEKNIIESLGEDWDTTRWVNSWKYIDSCDAAGNEISSLSQEWDDSTGWVNRYLMMLEWDEYGNLVELWHMNWDSEQWINSQREQRLYDSAGNKIEELSQNWDGSQWENHTRNISKYDSLGRRIEDVEQYWYSSGWENSDRFLDIYDSTGCPIESLEQSWDDSLWIDCSSVIRTCDPSCDNDCVTEWIWRDWHDTVWVNFSRMLLSYDQNGHLVEFLDMRWDGEQWQNNYLNASNYDSAGYLIESLTQSWDGLEWVNADRFTWTYLPFLSINAGDAVPGQYMLLQNYPNPFNPSTTICYDLPHAGEVSLVVYDLLGREVTRLVQGTMEPGYHEVHWDGRESASGIYITRLATPEYSKSIKMLLLK